VTVENNESRLAVTYETIRRREYELITRLLELLPKIDTIGEDKVAQVRDALFHADHPFLMVFVGPFSSGKSSLINALVSDDDLLAVGPVPTTDRISILRWGEDIQRMDSGGAVETVFCPAPMLEKVSFVDTPGLESVFQQHEALTRGFLHRSDVVMLVMLATQAMTQRNLEYIQHLRQYGKKVIILINQADLLSEEEAETVRNYVLEQSQDLLKFRPEVWLVSAKLGLAARRAEPFDEALWLESGLFQIEDYIDDQLGDVDRMRQKLQTPLLISQNVHGVALEAVKANQAVLDKYQSISDNVEQQLAAYKREQDKIVRELNEEIALKFTEATRRSGAAIRDVFQLSRVLDLLGRGIFDLTGLSRLFRRSDRQSYARLAFARYKAFEPINQLPNVADKLGPRLEGKDLQDIDDLVRYAQTEIRALPPLIRSKVIGDIQPPVKYDRTALQNVRPELETIEGEAREVEVETLDQKFRNVWFSLAIWELLVLFVIVVILVGGLLDFGEPISFGVLIFLLLLGITGLLAMPIVGRTLETGHTNRLLRLQSRYIDVMTRAADKQIDYGMRLRRDVVAPLTRLVEAQTQIQTEQLTRLQEIDQEMVSIESELSRMSKKKTLGMRG